MAESKSKKKGKLNSQPSSPHIDIGEMTNRYELRCGEDDVTASMSELRCGEDDGTASRSELRCGEDADELNFDIYRFKYQFLSSYQNVNGDDSGEIDCALDGFGVILLAPTFHEFEKPNDETALNLMNSCHAAVLEEYPNIIFAYGYSHFHRSSIIRK
ncbi:hypothetical protein F2Q68_00002490 [Brassica cretica]|uniref:tRNAHis guanylyltransferase catalytic domain-containing protein n=1 Tax=Brassica cretica TaxID=69181 RepID=A0A8S9J6C2_BRACR|nr:hypothetical protein F2Q68_00002490 [Brassica cretica]